MRTDTHGHAERRVTVLPKLVGVVAVAVLATVFVFRSTAKGQVNVLFWSIRTPAWIWLLAVFSPASPSARRSRGCGAGRSVDSR